MKPQPKIVLFANTDWYLLNFRLSLAKALREEGWQAVFVSPSGNYARRLQQSGFRWIRLDFSTRGTNLFHEALVVLRLARLYRRERPVLAHHFTIKCNLYGTIAARFARGISVVNSITGLGHVFIDPSPGASLLRCMAGLLYSIILRLPHQRVIFENQEDRDSFYHRGFLSRGKAHIIRGAGVDCHRFRPELSANLPESAGIRVLLASRLIREKGIREFLDAARIVKARTPGIEFVLAGGRYEGNPSSFSEAEIGAIRREGLVEYLGHRSDMPSVMAGCHIFVLPSYGEGTPSSLLEAAACEKPIVATRIAGCQGIVLDGVNGFLVPVRDAASLAVAIERLAGDHEMRRQFGKAGRQIVMGGFDEKILIGKTLRVYRELLGQRH